jgi:hypothetical protein
VALHLYCVAKSRIDEGLGRIGVGGHQVYGIGYRDLVAFVSESPVKYDLIGDMRSHESIIEKLSEKSVAIPLRYGQLAKNRDEVKGFLVQNYGFLKDLVERLKGKVELNIKLFWRLEKALTKLSEEHLPIKVLAKQMSEMSQEKAYPLKIRLGQMIEKKLNEIGKKIVGEMYMKLKPLSVDIKENDTLTTEMMWNVVFLVNSSVESKFDQAVNELEEKYGELLSFKYLRSPPYSFTSIRVGG